MKMRANGYENEGWSPIVVAALAILAVCLIVWLKMQKNPVVPTPAANFEAAAENANPGLPPVPAPTIDYAALVRLHAAQAHDRNRMALEIFKMDIDRVFGEHETKLVAAARAAADAASGYRSCCKIIYCLAWDKVKGGNETDDYLNELIHPHLEPTTRAQGADLQATMQALEYELCKSSVHLAHDLAALDPARQNLTVATEIEAAHELDLQTALRNIGFDATGVIVSGVFDVAALCKAQLAKTFWKKISAVAARMFGKQVARVGASAAVAAADGPLPIGDVVAVVGLAWTGYDIYASRRNFEREIRVSLENMATESRHAARKAMVEQASAMLRQHQKIQHEIGSQALVQINRGE